MASLCGPFRVRESDESHWKPNSLYAQTYSAIKCELDSDIHLNKTGLQRKCHKNVYKRILAAVSAPLNYNGTKYKTRIILISKIP